MLWIKLIWLRIGTSGGLLWTRYWTFGSHKMLGIFWVAAQLAASQEGLSSMSEWYLFYLHLEVIHLYVMLTVQLTWLIYILFADTIFQVCISMIPCRLVSGYKSFGRILLFPHSVRKLQARCYLETSVRPHDKPAAQSCFRESLDAIGAGFVRRNKQSLSSNDGITTLWNDLTSSQDCWNISKNEKEEKRGWGVC
jgi:hypothetical protein